MTTTTVCTKDRPILFSGLMVRAILEGRKTQTRRVLKHGAPSLFADPMFHYGDGTDGRCWYIAEAEYPEEGSIAIDCPYGQPGDRLWVRETHAIVPKTAYGFDREKHPLCWQIVRPNDNHDAAIFKEGWTRCAPGRWRPSIHMPRWASRISLEITGVRVERLLEINYQDALAEGISRLEVNGTTRFTRPDYDHQYASPINAFGGLWESINGAGSWKANPWVWVVDFRRVNG